MSYEPTEDHWSESGNPDCPHCGRRYCGPFSLRMAMGMGECACDRSEDQETPIELRCAWISYLNTKADQTRITEADLAEWARLKAAHESTVEDGR